MIVGNLGLYQVIVTFAKRLGGPIIFMLLLMAVGYLIIRPTEFLIKKLVGALKQRILSRKSNNNKVVNTYG